MMQELCCYLKDLFGNVYFLQSCDDFHNNSHIDDLFIWVIINFLNKFIFNRINMYNFENCKISQYNTKSKHLSRRYTMYWTLRAFQRKYSWIIKIKSLLNVNVKFNSSELLLDKLRKKCQVIESKKRVSEIKFYTEF